MLQDTNNSINELRSGTTLNSGKYIIVGKIGEGGFSITYRARQANLNRMVCIKEYFLAGRCLRNTNTNNILFQNGDIDIFEKYRQAFVHEAETVASLHHPNIVEVIDIFDENNTSYMVMPFIEGQTLESLVEKNGPLSYADATNYMSQIADAVDYIHQRNILHRDIKPGNIMITADYRAILIDFGSAREFVNDKTQAHTSILTHGYAPPEQYSTVSRKGAYSDIYSLGATLYYVLTGKAPVDAAARITEAMPEPRQLNPSIPLAANNAIVKAMQLQTQQRQQSVAEFVSDLQSKEPLSQTAKIVNLPPTASVKTEPQASPASRNKWFSVIKILLVVFVSVIVLFLVLDFVLSNRSDGKSESSLKSRRVEDKESDIKVQKSLEEKKQVMDTRKNAARQQRDTLAVKFEDYALPQSLSCTFYGSLGSDHSTTLDFGYSNEGYDGILYYLNYSRNIEIVFYDRSNGHLILKEYSTSYPNEYKGVFNGTVAISQSTLCYSGNFKNYKNTPLEFSFHETKSP